MYNRGRTWYISWVLYGVIGAAMAQEMDDPMRPSTREPVEVAPTEPDAEPRAQKPRVFRTRDYTVESLYVMADRRRARINGTWYEVGDSLGTGRITDIRYNAAVVMAENHLHMLYPAAPTASFRHRQENE